MIAFIADPDFQYAWTPAHYQVNLLPRVIPVPMDYRVDHAFADRDTDFMLIVLIEAHLLGFLQNNGFGCIHAIQSGVENVFFGHGLHTRNGAAPSFFPIPRISPGPELEWLR